MKTYKKPRNVMNKTRWRQKTGITDLTFGTLDESTGLRKMGINEWRGRARDRDVWRRIGMEAKAHPGL
jgi:hypothetical protein